MKRSLAVVAVLAVALAPLYLLSEEPGKRPDRPEPGALFDRLDTNKDGTVSRDEVPQEHQRLFDRLLRAANKGEDGKLSREEFLAALPQGRPERPGDRPRAAEDGPRPQRPMFDRGAFFKRMDTNGDGKITKDELPEPARERFERMLERADKDGDGAISREEFESLGPPPGAGPRPGGPRPGFAPGPPIGVFRALDADGDGKLSASEIEAASAALKKLDKDGDGEVSFREVLALGGPGRGDAPRPEKRRPEGDRPKKRPDGGAFAERVFEKLDANKDGKLTGDELRGPIKERAATLDKDGDGAISLEELKAAGPRGFKKGDGEGRPKKKRPAGDDAPKKKPAGDDN